MIKIGVVFPPTKSGGVFQYALTILESLTKYSQKFHCLNLDPKEKSFFKRILYFSNLILDGKFFFLKNSYSNSEVDLLIFPTPFSFEFPSKTPYIVAIPDLMHRYYPSFPGYGLGERLTRNIVYGYYAKHSVLNVVDSQQGAEDLHKFFGIPKEKIKIIPFIPAEYVYKYKHIDLENMKTLLEKFNLPEKFLFYPAQLWYQKNHLRLIKALSLIKENYGIEIPLVLSGSLSEEYQQNYQKIKKLSKELKIENQIVHLGYVSNKEIVALYKKSTALIFPSLIGPTNIPPLEAMVLGTPVVCSNLFGMPEQIGEAGILFDPFDVKDMADKIYKVWIDEDLKKELIKKGYDRAKNFSLESYANQWEGVIEEVLKITKT